MKRFISLLLSALLMLSTLPGVVFAAENTADVTIADAVGEVGDIISLQVKLSTSGPVDSIALRDLVYDKQVLEFAGFADYSALEDNAAWDITVKDDIEFISTALNSANVFDGNIVSLKFKVLAETETAVSLSAIIKNDAVEFVPTVVSARVNKASKTATFTLTGATAKVNEIVTIPVKLTTTVAVDTLAIRSLVYDKDILEFTGFDDYSALEADKAWDVTIDNDNEFISTALNSAKVFDENVVSLKFNVLKQGTTDVSFTAIVKNDAEEIAATVNKATVTAESGEPAVIDVTEVTLDDSEITLTEGDSFKLNAEVKPDNATDKTVTWSSSKEDVATVLSDGTVKAVGVGEATITVVSNANTNAKAECVVTVNAKEALKTASFVLDDASAKVGDIVTIPVKLTTTTAVDTIAIRNLAYDNTVLKFEGFADYSALEEDKAWDITVDEINKYLSAAFSSAKEFNETIVSLKFEALKDGTSDVSFTAIVKNDAEVIASTVDSATVTVEANEPVVVPVTSVELNETSKTLTVDDTFTLKATVNPDNATDKTVTWSSNKEDVAIVLSDGTVKAVGVGEATITVVSNANTDAKAECVVKVNAKETPKTATFVLTDATAKVGETVTIPVKLTTTVAVDTIAIKGLDYDESLLKFIGFADYTALEEDKAWDVTIDMNNEFMSSALNSAKVFDENIVSLKFEVIGEGTSDVSFTAITKNDAVVVDATVNKAVVTIESAGPGVIDVEEVILDETEIQITEGDSFKLNATVKPDDATDKAVIWSSSSDDVVTVASDGTVTAIGVGEATITATSNFNEDIKAECKVTVKAKEALKTATFSLTGTTAKVGEVVTVPVKLTTTVAVDTIAIRNLVYNDAVLKFVGFADYSALEEDKAWDVTIDEINGYLSAAFNSGKIFDKNVVSLKFELIGEGTSDVSFTAVVKNDAEVIAATVNKATVTAEAGEATKTAAFNLTDVSAKVGETVKVPVKLTTSDPADSIAIRDLVYDNTVLKFKGFADYDALDSWGVTSDTDKLFFSAPLNMSKIFDGEQIATIEFEALKEGSSEVSFTGVVKNDTVDFEESVTDATVTVEAAEPTVVPVTSVTLSETAKTVKVEESFTLTATVNPENATDKTVTWESSDPTVAKVENGVVTALKVGTATITAKANNGVEATCTVTVDPIPVTSVTLSETAKTIKVEESFTLTATVNPENATDKTVTWESSDPTVAKVENGVVTALKVGTATITAKANNGVKAVCTVTVDPIPVTSVTLSETAKTVKVNDSFTLTATVNPDNATDKTVTWESSDPTVAKVENGVVTALKVGTATITAKANNGVEATCTVTVQTNVIDVTSVTLSETAKTIKVEESFTLTATVLPENATVKTVTWESSDPTVAKVENGVVTALKVGTATITAKANNGVKAVCTVTVDPIPVTSVTLNETSKTLTEDDTFTLVATVNPDNATDKTVTWESSDPTVAKVENGVVTALKAGTATITAKAGDKTATCEVEVAAGVIPVTSVILNLAESELTVGDTLTLEATVVPSDASDKTIVWTSSDAEVAKVENGVVTALKAGTVTITAEANNGVSATCTITVNAKALTGDITIISDGDVLVYSDAFGDAVKGTDYEVKWFRDGEEFTVTGDSYTITEADYGKTIMVKAIGNGETYVGEFFDEIVIPARVPSDVLVNTSTTSNSITVTLRAKDNGAAVEKFIVTITDEDGNSETVDVVADNGEFKHKFTDLETGTRYTITAVAVNSAGESDPVSVTATPRRATTGGSNNPTVIRPANPSAPVDPVDPIDPIDPGTTDRFDDDNGRWSEPEIEKAAERGLAQGKEYRIFDPVGNLTRHENNRLLMNFAEAIGAELSKTEGLKIDTDPAHWAWESDDWATAVGVMKGTAVLEDGTIVISGEANITRQDYMTTIYRMLKAVLGNVPAEGESVKFADADDISDYAKEAVEVLSAIGVVKGCEKSDTCVVNPKSQITREEAVAILNRVFDFIESTK